MPRFITNSWLSPAFTARRPVIQSAVIKAIATSKPYAGRKKPPIRKTSGNIFSVRGLPLQFHEIQQQQAASNNDRGIGGVEGRPLITANIKQQKIGHLIEMNAVEDVPHGASQDEGQCNGGFSIEP